MRKWMLKAAVQRAIGLVPGGRRVNVFLQEHVTRSIHLRRDEFADHLRRDAVHLNHFRSMTNRDHPCRVLEVGTGWHPILPIAMWLCGADEVITYDIAPQLSTTRLRQTIDAFSAAIDDGSLTQDLPAARADRIVAFREIAKQPMTDHYAFLKQMNIHPCVADASYADVKNGSVDFIVSNVALEYVAQPKLDAMCREFARVIADDGAMSHDICMQDQYAFFDNSISKLNFLRFSDRSWRIINNAMISLSRLRAPDYSQAFEKAGFEIELRDPLLLSEEGVRSIPLAERFREYSIKDLQVLRCHFVSKSSELPQPKLAAQTFVRSKSKQSVGACLLGGLTLVTDWIEGLGPMVAGM